MMIIKNYKIIKVISTKTIRKKHIKVNINKLKKLLTSWRILLSCTSCFLNVTTSCSIEFRSDLSAKRSSLDEFIKWDCKLSCCRCLRCSRNDALAVDDARLCALSNERGLSDPWLNGELLLLLCKRRCNKRVARAGNWDLHGRKRQFSALNLN